LIKLNTNENPYPPSPKALAAMQGALSDELRLYPDPNADALKEAVARFYNIDKATIFMGNGSDEVLGHVFYGLLKQKKPILFPDITYSFYPVYCGLYDIPFQPIPLNERFEINVQDYMQPNGGIIFPNPNAPTGMLTPLQNIRQLLEKNTESVVVIDEAYIDFGGESAVALTREFSHLLVVQTLSKSRSLAGLRVGLAIGNPDLITGLERIKNSFNSYPLGRLAIAGAAAAFDDREYFRQTTRAIINNRQQLSDELKKLGFDVLPSTANFIFARHPSHEGIVLAQALRECAVLVRHFNAPRIEQFLRITIGSPAQNAELITAIKNLM
jgi:histidinol-phosphate aminotransferase